MTNPDDFEVVHGPRRWTAPPIAPELAEALRQADTRCRLSPGLLALLLALKQQLEEDAVLRDHLTGWCRSLPRLIEQDAMPKAWDQLVAYLKEHGHAV